MSIKENLAELSMADLVALYKELTGKTIKKFDSKPKGVARIEKLLAERKAQHEEEIEAEGETEEAADEKPKAPRSKGGRTAEVVKMLREKPYTTQELMDHFDTKYKNVTGDLYLIRNRGEAYGLHGDERLRKEAGAYTITRG